jgi:hypothetical protein
MKSAHPQGQRFSWRSRRSGRQTRSEVICLTPSRFRLLTTARPHGPVFISPRSVLPALCPVAASRWIFIPKVKTIENVKSFL